MKLTFLLTLATILHVSAASYSQNAKLTLNLKSASYSDLFKAIEEQTEFTVFYKNSQIDMGKKISLEAKNSPIKDVLDESFKGTELVYKLLDKIIVVTSKNQLAIKVTGTVKSSTDNLAIPGVSVMEKGTKNGTITDIDGKFVLDVSNPEAVLVFTFIGYLSSEVALTGRTTVDVVLKEKVEELSQVVVVGYGKVERKKLASSITSINPDEMNKGAISDISQLIQGKAPGLNITVSGDPTRRSSVILRGTSTLNGSMEPFYVIDGVAGADISLVATDDIQSIDILKDAAATSIYGTRASNGIIMVTTKKGKKGAPQISYNGYIGFEKVANSLKLMNASQIRAYTSSTSQNLTEDTGADTDWQKEIQRETALSKSHNLSFSGGGEHNNYSANINYVDKEGILRESNQNKIVARLSFDQFAFNDKLKLGVNVSNARITSDYVPLLGAVLYQTAYHLPTSPVKNSDGSYFENYSKSGYFNPVSILDNAQSQQKSNNLVASFSANAKLPWGFTYDMNYSYQNYSGLYGEFYGSYLYGYNGSVFYNNPDPPSTRSIVTFYPGGSALRSSYQSTNQILENWVTFNQTFAGHSINAVLGYSTQSDEYGDGFTATNANFPVNSVSYNNLALGNYSAVAGYKVNFGDDQAYYKTKLISNFARLNYNYRDRYYLQASIRRDGSSVFGKNNRWGYFPSIGLSWRAGEEDFIKKMDLFYDLKFRGSYGITGNSTGFNAYTAQFLSSSMGTFNFNGTNQTAYGPNKAANPDLKWEKTSTANIGADIAFFSGKLNFTFDWYNKKTTDMIYWYGTESILVPAGSIVANGGSLSNKGYEISVTATPVSTKDFTWKSSINLAHNKNEITSLSNPYFSTVDSIRYTQPDGSGQTGSTLQIRKVGYPIGQFFTLIYAGKNSDGVSQYLAKNGSLTTNPTTSDYRYAGSPQPVLTYGWSNSFTYKNFDLNIFLRGVYGNKIFNATRADLFRPSTAAFSNILVDAANESVKDFNSFRYSSRFIEDGSYIRLENLSLGYTINKPIKSISNIRVYATVNNLFVISKYNGIDPEINMGGSAPGIDSNNFYPKTRTVLFGVNVNL